MLLLYLIFSLENRCMWCKRHYHLNHLCRVLEQTERLGGNPHLVQLIDRLKTIYQVPEVLIESK